MGLHNRNGHQNLFVLCNLIYYFTIIYLEISVSFDIADFIGLPYFSGFPSGLKSHVLISHDFLSQSKFGPFSRDREARGQHQNTKRNSVL